MSAEYKTHKKHQFHGSTRENPRRSNKEDAFIAQRMLLKKAKLITKL